MSHVGADSGTAEEELPVAPQADAETWPEVDSAGPHLGPGSKIC